MKISISGVRKNLILLYIHYMLFFAWIGLMVLIFWFSNIPADESTEQSLTIGKFICSLVVNGFDEMSASAQIDQAKLIDHAVRKSAHFCEFAALGALTFNSAYLIFNSLKVRKRVNLRKGYLLIFSILWCILYAATDEVHQLFVEGRYGSPLDVLLDTAGSVTAMLIIILIKKNIDKRREKAIAKENKNSSNSTLFSSKEDTSHKPFQDQPL